MLPKLEVKGEKMGQISSLRQITMRTEWKQSMTFSHTMRSYVHPRIRRGFIVIILEDSVLQKGQLFRSYQTQQSSRRDFHAKCSSAFKGWHTASWVQSQRDAFWEKFSTFSEISEDGVEYSSSRGAVESGWGNFGFQFRWMACKMKRRRSWERHTNAWDTGTATGRRIGACSEAEWVKLFRYHLTQAVIYVHSLKLKVTMAHSEMTEISEFQIWWGSLLWNVVDVKRTDEYPEITVTWFQQQCVPLERIMQNEASLEKWS